MEMERINENTIRVLIGNSDLSDRGITVLDLLGNHKEVESFFYDILEEVDTDHQFIANDAVTFQVLPNRNGLELFISKNADTDEAVSNILDGLNNASVDKDDPDEISDQLRKTLMGTDDDNDDASDDESFSRNDSEHSAVTPSLAERVVELPDFEALIGAVNATDEDPDHANLYSYNGTYYLDVILNASGKQVGDYMSVLYEFGKPTKISGDFLREHGKLVMEEAAFSQTRHYFN